MKGVVIQGVRDVAVHDVPMPTIKADTDVILKTRLSGLCGSDLHSYRQTDPGVGFTIGHEVVSEVYEVGSAVKKFKVGDIVASPFASNCGDCWYCSKGYTARCAQAQPFGSPALNGAQAEYVRQPLADAALFTIPPGVPEHLMLLLCDILPTGYSCAYHGRRLLDEDDDREMTSPMDGVAVVIGCGPVGLCCISSAKLMFKTVYATDPSPARRALAEKHGAIALPLDELHPAILQATDGRGADAALELVGNEAALKTSMDLVRPFGAVSSIGMHIKPLTLSGEYLYSKK
ncbi:chaperonin 10-like protein [Dioszegia hungarica]|uniref:Chaperonin 10-like protein n=1 Tax=Dioszegia hungarica TaxID=4972 RepID=A0AA38LRF1_9TREE|nr:chaperonin 10-like protein [Dioszegia hungarica]KAI9632895.1 chaperonin 10-like protein [Dioszegia hungarica]